MAKQDPKRIHQDPDHASHQEAAKHHDAAALHHRDAAKFLEAGDREAAGYQAYLAHSLALRAVHHSDEAAKAAVRWLDASTKTKATTRRADEGLDS